MRDIVKEYQEKFRRNHQRARRYTALLLALALTTSLFVNWQLHSVGIAKTAEYLCGEVEHEHTAACYEKQLVCGYEEGEPEDWNATKTDDGTSFDDTFGMDDDAFGVDADDPGIAAYSAEPEYIFVPHEHTDDCYQEVQELTCREEEHEHADDCFDPEDGSLICDLFEHTHDDSCYTTTYELVCGLEEGELVEEVNPDYDPVALFEEPVAAKPVVVDPVIETPVHHHTDACYEEVLVCGLPEHHHTVNCLSDPLDGTQDEDEWLDKTGTALTGMWNEDLLTVAQGQLGYEQSEKNFKLDTDDGETLRYYTRYGQWYGNPYGEWDVMFLSYCLNYANIPQSAIPQRASTLALRSELRSTDYLLDPDSDIAPYEMDAGMSVTGLQPGDIVFYNATTTETVAVADEPQIEDLSPDADTELLQALSAPAAAEPQTEERTVSYETVGIVSDVDEASGTMTVISGNVDGKVSEVSLALSQLTGVIPVASVQAAESETDAVDGKAVTLEGPFTPLNEYVTDFIGRGTRYDADNDYYTSDLHFDFQIPKDKITETGYKYEINLPAGVIVPDQLLNVEGDLKHDTSTTEGHYTFIKNSDGTYSAVLSFNKSFVEDSATDITGFVNFKGELAGNSKIEDGKIKISFSKSVDVKVEIDSDTFPDNKTHDYDLTVKKDGSYSAENNQLVYTVTVFSKNGTPQDIDFKDIIKVKDGSFTLDSPKSVTVVKEDAWDQWQNSFETQPPISDINYTYNNGELSMKLPQLTGKGKHEYGSRYKITYVFDVPKGVSGNHWVNNEVSSVSHDTKTDLDIKDDAKKDVEIKREYDVKKESGWYSEDDGSLHWKLTVNSNKQNIAGWTLTDSMFGLVDGDLKISPATDTNYTIQKDESGKITGILFNKASGTESNNQTYTIEYTTKGNKGLDGQKVTNDYTFKPGSGEGISGSSSGTIPGVQDSFKKEVVSDSIDNTTHKAAVTWKTSLTVLNMDKLPKDTIISDDCTVNQYNNTGAFHALTRQQVQDWGGKFSWDSTEASIYFSDTTAFEVKIEGSDGRTYNFSTIDSAPEDTTFTKFTIKLLKDLVVPAGTKEMSWQYATTTVDLTTLPGGESNFYNTAKLNEKPADATYKHSNSKIVKMDGNSQTGITNTSSTDGTIKWIVCVTLDSEAHSKLTITDNLPDGVTLTHLQVKENGGNWREIMDKDVTAGSFTAGDDNNDYSLSGSYTGNTVTIDLTRKDTTQTLRGGQTYDVVYTCKVTREDLQGNTVYTLTNNASAKFDGTGLISDSQTQNWQKITQTVTSKVLSKSVDSNNDATHSQLDYTIEINPDGKDLLTGADYLTLTDLLKMPNYPDQVICCKGDWHQDPWLKDCTVDAVLNVSSVKLYYAAKDAEGNLLKDSNGKLVAGSEVTGWTWTYDIDTATNDNRTWHKIVVSNVPDDQPMIFKYTYQVTNNIEEVLKKNCSSLLNYYKFFGGHHIENTASLDGTGYQDNSSGKTNDWKNASSSGGVSSGKSYTLYKVEKGNYGKVLEGAVFQLQAYSNGSYTGMDKTYTTGASGTLTVTKDSWVNFQPNVLYRLIEISAPSGYKKPDEATCEANAIYFYFSDADAASTLPDPLPSSAVDLNKRSGTAYIQNEVDDTPSYELPSTGGAGTKLYTAGGGALMLAALVCGVCRKRRRERRAH